MSNLYRAPFESGAIGDTLTFTMTGTSTPQNIYADPDFDDLLSNPIEADANGDFPPIYLNPELPDYRVDKKDINGVSYPGYPVDNVPAASDQATAYRVKGTSPQVIFEKTDAAPNEGKWRIKVVGTTLVVSSGDDAESTWTDLLVLSRGTPLITSGSFTGTFTGFTTTVTGTVFYRVQDDQVEMWVETQVSATSNSTAMTVTGMPASLYPADTSHTAGFRVIDNGSHADGVAAISGLGVITLLNNGGNFTNSGTKGVPRGWSIRYPL